MLDWPSVWLMSLMCVQLTSWHSSNRCGYSNKLINVTSCFLSLLCKKMLTRDAYEADLLRRLLVWTTAASPSCDWCRPIAGIREWGAVAAASADLKGAQAASFHCYRCRFFKFARTETNLKVMLLSQFETVIWVCVCGGLRWPFFVITLPALTPGSFECFTK